MSAALTTAGKRWEGVIGHPQRELGAARLVVRAGQRSRRRGPRGVESIGVTASRAAPERDRGRARRAELDAVLERDQVLERLGISPKRSSSSARSSISSETSRAPAMRRCTSTFACS